MTTIAYRDGVMAGDTLICNGTDTMGHITKVYKVNGFLIGVAGTLRLVVSFWRWAETGLTDESKMPCAPNFSLLEKDNDSGVWGYVVTPSGKIYRYENLGHALPVEADYAACGSGREYAMGAMGAGKSAFEAVAIACQFDISSGGKIRSVSLGD